MMRRTIDFGIDLGTTNSSVALLNGTETEMIENNEGQKCTPSVIWLDKKDRLYVGRRAKNQLERDPENACGEFKLQMGTTHTYTFQRSGLQMRPEELSAEVLKSLRNDVRQRIGEEVNAAVITVPAAFELPQCEATNKAARLAGMTTSPLLQEPIAAALAYGFQCESENEFWLVYDMGGGTFDAAIIHMKDGEIQVVNHRGDNHLGGKLMDWAIVDQLLAPALRKEYALSNFERGNPAWRAAFAKLKHHADEAKIQLSRDEETQIFIDPLCQDDNGDWVQFEWDIRRADIEPLIEPFIERSLNICDRILTEEGLGPDDIAKILLVGGPTMIPLLRDSLYDRLQIELDFSVDPLTVVSRGAAVFAGSLPFKESALPVLSHGQYAIELEYKPIDNDPEPLVAGKISAQNGDSLSNLTIEFIESKSLWRSGQIEISPSGGFMTNLRAERGRANEYQIELKNQSGQSLETVPNSLTYTLGATISAQPLIHSVGVALANNEVQVFLEKGKELPARRREIFRTTEEVKKGNKGAILRIPVVEGENAVQADRNQLIGDLIVTGADVKRDVPIGSEVELTIVVDDSRQIHTMAYVPILDEEYEEVLHLEKPNVDTTVLGQDVEKEESRLEKLKSSLSQIHHPHSERIIQQLDREQTMNDIKTSYGAATSDRDAADACQRRLLDLKSSLDEVEQGLRWPSLVKEAHQLMAETRDLFEQCDNSVLRPHLNEIEGELHNALRSLDEDLLKQQINKLQEINMELFTQMPDFWKEYYNYLNERRTMMKDQDLANRLFGQGERALKNQDAQALESSVRRLVALLPISEHEEIKNLHSTVMPLLK